jgi:hypothetical protein
MVIHGGSRRGCLIFFAFVFPNATKLFSSDRYSPDILLLSTYKVLKSEAVTNLV